MSGQSVQRPPSRLRRSLDACTADGTAHAVMVGCGETYFPAFALVLGSTPTEVGLLATVPVMVGAAFQMLAPFAARRVGNKRWVVASATLQAFTFIPIVLLAGAHAAPFWTLLGWISLYWALALGINPPWNVWMGRMIPAEIRSRYFGRRNVYLQAALLGSLLSGGLLLHFSERGPWGATAGFVALFTTAALARLLSAWFLGRQHEPAPEGGLDEPVDAPVRQGFLRHPYGRIVRLVVLITGSVHLSAAYFTPYMLQELRLSYAQFTALNATVLVARLMSSAYWGELARTFGNRRTLQVAAVLLVPLSGLWVVSDNFAYLVVLQLYAGFAWSGFELLTILSFFDCTEERNRARVLSVYALLSGMAMVTSSLVGGAILRFSGADGYPILFIGSSLLRLLTVILFAGRVGRKRADEHSFRDVFVRVLTLRPTEGPQLRPLVLGRRRRKRR